MLRFHPFPIKKAVLIAALAAAGSGVAHAGGDSSLNPFIGESYAYFNGADRPAVGSGQFNDAPSAWRQAHPNGLTERQLEALASESLPWRPLNARFDDAPSAWRQTHPSGLTERQLEALSSDGSPWQLSAGPGAASS
jgi:hypothetical protein